MTESAEQTPRTEEGPGGEYPRCLDIGRCFEEALDIYRRSFAGMIGLLLLLALPLMDEQLDRCGAERMGGRV